jgi:hypothetical protein
VFITECEFDNTDKKGTIFLNVTILYDLIYDVI